MPIVVLISLVYLTTVASNSSAVTLLRSLARTFSALRSWDVARIVSEFSFKELVIAL